MGPRNQLLCLARKADGEREREREREWPLEEQEESCHE